LSYIRAPKNKLWGRALRDATFFIRVFVCLLWQTLFGTRRTTWLFVSNPPILPLAGAVLAPLARVHFVYLLHDLYPDLAIAVGELGERSICTRLLRGVTTFSFRVADRIVCLGSDVRNRLVDIYSVTESKIRIIPNWASPLGALPTEALSQAEQLLGIGFSIVYTGNLGRYYALERVIEAAELLREHEGIQFVFLGHGAMENTIRQQASNLGLENVRFLPYQPTRVYKAILLQADALLVTLQEGMTGISVPSKTYAYLAAGKPIVGMLPPDSEIAMLLDEAQCGVYARPGDVQGFCRQVLDLVRNPLLQEALGVNALDTFWKAYTRENVTRQFVEVI
jgi:glycosyltransferase involved in cell wall biosynthesis